MSVSLPPQHQEVEHSLVPPGLLLLLLHLLLHTLPVAEVCEHLHQILGHSGRKGVRRRWYRVREGEMGGGEEERRGGMREGEEERGGRVRGRSGRKEGGRKGRGERQKVTL